MYKWAAKSLGRGWGGGVIIWKVVPNNVYLNVYLKGQLYTSAMKEKKTVSLINGITLS